MPSSGVQVLYVSSYSKEDLCVVDLVNMCPYFETLLKDDKEKFNEFCECSGMLDPLKVERNKGYLRVYKLSIHKLQKMIDYIMSVDLPFEFWDYRTRILSHMYHLNIKDCFIPPKHLQKIRFYNSSFMKSCKKKGDLYLNIHIILEMIECDKKAENKKWRRSDYVRFMNYISQNMEDFQWIKDALKKLN